MHYKQVKSGVQSAGKNQSNRDKFILQGAAFIKGEGKSTTEDAGANNMN